MCFEAPSWKLFSKAQAAPLRGHWCVLEATWSQLTGGHVPWQGSWPSDRSWGHEEPEWMVPAAAARTQGDTSKHRFSAEECQNILYCNVKNMCMYMYVFYTAIYQNIVFSRTLYFLRNFGYSIFSFLIKAKRQ